MLYIFTDEVYYGLNWYFVKLYNKCPVDVYYLINMMDTPTASLIPNESFSFDMRRWDAIEKIYLFCNTGNNATVSIHRLK